jgi:hypothetical protein
MRGQINGASGVSAISHDSRASTEQWKVEVGALEEISPALSVDIGYFGLGSDSAIVLDYRQDRNNPSVIRLKWQKPQPNTWVRCAENFDQFADMLGLDHGQ